MMRDIFQPASMSGGGCVWHLVTYNATSGNVLNKSSTPQGLGLNTIWSRGQGWAINGFVVAFRYTSNMTYLAQAQAASECYIRHVTACCDNAQFEWAPLWDFSVTEPNQVSADTSAAMIAVDGMIEVALASDPATRTRYLAFAKTTIDAILAKWQFAAGANDAVLNNATVTWPATGFSLIYADYYLLEAAMRWDNIPQSMRDEAAAYIEEHGRSFVAAE